MKSKKNLYGTYCDNQNLRDMILKVHPSSEGLFPHEILMLQRVSWGGITTNTHNFTSMSFVKYPDELLKSLIRRGFVRECYDDEMADCLKMKEIQTLLRNHGLKPGNIKEKSLALLKETMNGNEICAECGYRYYVLSDTGKKAYAYQNGTLDQTLNFWTAFHQDKKVPKLTAKQLHIWSLDSDSYPVYKLSINSHSNSSTLILLSASQINVPLQRVVNFDKRATIKIYLDDIFFLEEYDIDTFQVLYNVRKVLIGRRIKNGDILCRCYNFSTMNVVAEEIIPEYIYKNGATYEMQLPINNLAESNYGICVESRINYFFSIRDELADEIITKYISKSADVVLLPPIIKNNKTKNYRVSVCEKDDSIQDLIMYMIIVKRLERPSIMDVPIVRLLRAMILKSNSIIQQAILDNWTIVDQKVVTICDCISKEISSDPQKVISSLLLTYPPRTLSDNPYPYYTGETQYQKDYAFFRVVKYRDEYDKKFSELLAKLKTDGLLSVKWINEYSLFKIAKAHFDDCEYQKKFDWLGQQSLDIYIPQKRIALEYQGIQHYEPVELFGGKQGFLETKERDARKMKLCLENGVKLIYWPYNLEVNNDNFEKVIEQAKNQ